MMNSLYASRYYFDQGAREIAHGIKEGNDQMIRLAAQSMAAKLPTDKPVILIPVPSRKGYATSTLELANAIRRERAGRNVVVVDALKGRNRASLYDAKKQGDVKVDSSWFGYHLTKELPNNTDLFLVDNVESTGATIKAAIEACGRGQGLVYAYDETHGRGLLQSVSESIQMKSATQQPSTAMSLEQILFADKSYPCRVITDCDGDSIKIATEELYQALFEGKTDEYRHGFEKSAEKTDNQVFYFTKLPLDKLNDYDFKCALCREGCDMETLFDETEMDRYMASTDYLNYQLGRMLHAYENKDASLRVTQEGADAFVVTYRDMEVMGVVVEDADLNLTAVFDNATIGGKTYENISDVDLDKRIRLDDMIAEFCDSLGYISSYQEQAKKDVPKPSAISPTINKTTRTMTPKNHQEEKASNMQVEMLAKAMENATKNNGVFLNAERRTAPSLFPRGRGTGGFNALILGLHADQGGYQTGVYTLFNEAKKADVSIKQKQHGIPVMFTKWDSYANIKNPEVTISKDEYKAMSPADQSLYRAKPTRELRVLFNIDQTTMSSVKKEDYERMVTEKGSLEARGALPVDDNKNRIKVNDFILKMRENLVPIRRESTGFARYDAVKDSVYIPDQKRFERYEDYVQETLRQVVSATGHQERLARQGVEVPNGKAPEQDKVSRERLVEELASAIKMQEMGMTARLSPESMALVPEWTKAMKENPCYLDSVAVDVNSALDVIAKAERGEKVEYASVRNQQQTAELNEAIGQNGKVNIETVQMMKDDNNRWTIYLKPEGKPGFNLYPEREDLNRFFTTLKNGPEEALDKLRTELAQKYYAIGTSNPQLKVDLFGRETPKADLDRITHANIFRTKEGKLMLLPTIADMGKQRPREITQSQWQRLWLSEDMAGYKKALAANVFKDVLHPELAEKQGQEEGVAIHQVPEWAVGYIVNGDATGLTDDEKKIVDDFIDKNFPDGFVPEVNEDNRNELNPNPAFGTRNEKALTGKGESPYQAVSTVEIAFHPAGEMRVMTKEQEKEFEKQQQEAEKPKQAEKQQEEKKNEEKKNEEKKAEEKKPELTPMLRQFLDLKKKHPDALLLFRCGDFYETYMQDAEASSKALGITLTRSSKAKDPEGKPLAMAGFPYHALDTYLPKLIRAGHRVAICDQLEAPKQTANRGIDELASKGVEKEQKVERNQEPEETQSRGMRR